MNDFEQKYANEPTYNNQSFSNNNSPKFIDHTCEHININNLLHSHEFSTRYFYICSLYLNSYAIPHSDIKFNPIGKLLFQRMLGHDILSDFSVNSLSDCIRALSYLIGFVTANDLSYFLGIDEIFLNTFFTRNAGEEKSFRRYKGCVNYTKWYYYIFNPDKRPFCDYPLPSPVKYAFKTLSSRALSHCYGTSLSQLTMLLYCAFHKSIKMNFETEVPLGNQGIRKSKIGCEITVDCLCTITDTLEHTPVKYICIEQDTGSESFSVLINKIYGYYNSNLYSADKASSISIMFSCHKVLPSDKRLHLFSKTRYVALYHFFNIILQLPKDDSYLFIDLYPIGSLQETYYKSDRLSQSGFFEYYVYTGYEFLAGTKLNLYDVSINSFIKEINSISSWGLDAFTQFCRIIGFLDHNDNYINERLPLSYLEHFIMHYPDETDLPSRVLFNKAQYSLSRHRLLGLSNALFQAISGKRVIGSSRRSSILSTCHENNILYLNPLLNGFSIWSVPSVLATDYMSYILWDRNAHEIKFIESVLGINDNYFYAPLSPAIRTSLNNLEIRFKNCYYTINNTIHKKFICIENIDADAGSFIRLQCYLSKCDSLNNMTIILLCDTKATALEFKNMLFDRCCKIIDIYTHDLYFLLKPNRYNIMHDLIPIDCI